MKITIHQNGLDVGPYTLEEAKALLAVGILAENDQARCEDGEDWAPLIKIISQSKSSPLPTLDKAASTTSSIPPPRTSQFTTKIVTGSTTSASSPAKPRPLPTLAKAASTTSAIPPAKPSPLTAKAKARSAASTGSPAKPSPLTAKAKARSAASVLREPKVPEMNQMLVSCVIGAAILILIPVLLMAFAPGEVAQLLGSSIKVGKVSIYAGPTEIVEGNWVTASLPTDSSGDMLHDDVLAYIYSVANKNSLYKRLSVTVHATATPTPKDVTLKIDDLDAVRAFPDEKAYAASDARKVIDADLTAAGL